jgi:hypothetical protein
VLRLTPYRVLGPVQRICVCVPEAETRDSHTAAILLAVAGVSLSVALVGCGSSSKPSSTTASDTSPQAIKYSDCMRAHGVPDFPDLNADGSVSLPSSINPQTPAFQAAQQTCASLRPDAGSPPPPITAAQQKKFVANAQCVRKHGFPNFPDPTFGAGGQGIGFNAPPGVYSSQSAGLLLASRERANVGSPLPLRELTQAGP